MLKVSFIKTYYKFEDKRESLSSMDYIMKRDDISVFELF